MRAQKVTVLGDTVGNLYDIFDDTGQWAGRVTYHGDRLVCIKGTVKCTKAIEQLIDALYRS